MTAERWRRLFAEYTALKRERNRITLTICRLKKRILLTKGVISSEASDKSKHPWRRPVKARKRK